MIDTTSVQRPKYEVYVWNDCSGWDYWSTEGELNYIQVTVHIKNTDLNDLELQQMKKDVELMHSMFIEFHSIDGYLSYLGGN